MSIAEKIFFWLISSSISEAVCGEGSPCSFLILRDKASISLQNKLASFDATISAFASEILSNLTRVFI